MDAMIVLTLNSGSSSLKFSLYRVEGSECETLMTGEMDRGDLRAEDARGAALAGTPMKTATPEAAMQAIAPLLARADLPAPNAIGHRIVHGGPKLLAHCPIDETVERELELASALSPLHAQAALAIIHLAKATWPDVPQVACFDTAFHAAMPDIARLLPVAKELQAEGVQRYGFHGLSCESIVSQLGPGLPAHLIIAHLGSGASITAVRDGCSVDTSMGLTPSGGAMMATRSGDLDPGILIYLLREKGLDAATLEDLIDHRSGLLGISGMSGDLRDLHAASSVPDAQLAIDMFCMSVAKQIGAMILALGGVDVIVFTGGIGENDALVRQAICHRLGAFDLRFYTQGDAGAIDGCGVTGPRCAVRVMPSQEDRSIARHVASLLSAVADAS